MKYFLLLFVSCCILVQSACIEVHSFEEIIPHIRKNSILLLDIDDTILIPGQMVGSDEWFQSIFQTYLDEGLNLDEAEQKAINDWVMVRHVTHMQLVEPIAPRIIRYVQDMGVAVMGFTTQSYILSARTQAHLQEHDVFLNFSSPHFEDVYFLEPKKGDRTGKQGVLFTEGILFTGGTHKGKSFFRFCDHIGYNPSHIVFLNDKASHLREIEEYAKTRGVTFTGLRYACSDPIKKRFCPHTAKKQFECIPYKKIISDEEVQSKLQR